MSVAIRAAAPGDEHLIFALIRGLAEYEKLLDEVRTDPSALAAALFAERPRVFCDIAEIGGKPAGFALWFYNFSTFTGRHGLYLEDLFVLPESVWLLRREPGNHQHVLKLNQEDSSGTVFRDIPANEELVLQKSPITGWRGQSFGYVQDFRRVFLRREIEVCVDVEPKAASPR